jgi:hypothetical protein
LFFERLIEIEVKTEREIAAYVEESKASVVQKKNFCSFEYYRYFCSDKTMFHDRELWLKRHC